MRAGQVSLLVSQLSVKLNWCWGFVNLSCLVVFWLFSFPAHCIAPLPPPDWLWMPVFVYTLTPGRSFGNGLTPAPLELNFHVFTLFYCFPRCHTVGLFPWKGLCPWKRTRRSEKPQRRHDGHNGVNKIVRVKQPNSVQFLVNQPAMPYRHSWRL